MAMPRVEAEPEPLGWAGDKAIRGPVVETVLGVAMVAAPGDSPRFGFVN